MSNSILRPLRDDPVNRGFRGLPGAHIIYDRHGFLCPVDDGAGGTAGADRA